MEHTNLSTTASILNGFHHCLKKSISFELISKTSHLSKAVITIDKNYTEALYRHIIEVQKQDIRTVGFNKGETPVTYFELTFKPMILQHLKEVLFNHCVFDSLYAFLIEKNIIICGEPRILSIVLDTAKDAQFVFELDHVPFELDTQWRQIPCKTPLRKNYKDIDRQVITFNKEELERAESYGDTGIETGDWVFFEYAPVNEQKKALLPEYKHRLWIKISTEDADKAIHELFIGRHKNDLFYTQNAFLHEILSVSIDLPYMFQITILDRLVINRFSFDAFKHHFSLQTPQQMHSKLIEVFSFRNDLSLRRETAEAVLKTLVDAHTIQLPAHLVDLQEKNVLERVQRNPDYFVYKAQKDFKTKIRSLAEKQLKEILIIDAIAKEEKIEADYACMSAYLNLFKRSRTKEFVYFDLPLTKIDAQETPLSPTIIHTACLREKTLNYIIKFLTKKS